MNGHPPPAAPPPRVDSTGLRRDNAPVMAEPAKPPLVKLICGLIASKVEWFDPAAEALAEALGPIDHASEIMDFDFTHYYDREMGSPLHRWFVSFAEPVEPDALVEAKLRTNAIEADFVRRYGGEVRRPINLDPGYVEWSKLVLASMKNFAHRIYLGRGVYAEVTLIYHRGRWDPLAWTFPDFASSRYHAFLSAVRDRLRQTSASPARPGSPESVEPQTPQEAGS